MTTLKILVGLALLVLAWLYIFRKNTVFQLNAWMRQRVFNDQVALFSGKRVAILLFALGGVALFSGIKNVVRVDTIPPNIAKEMVQQAREHLAHQEYKQVVLRCKELVRANPDTAEAWELLISAWSALGEKQLALQAAQTLLRLQPKNTMARNFMRRHNELKSS